MTDADLLRKALPRLHAAGIATRISDCGGRLEMRVSDIVYVDDQFITTYAIGAIVEALSDEPTCTAIDTGDDDTSLLCALLCQAERFNIIPQEPTNAA